MIINHYPNDHEVIAVSYQGRPDGSLIGSDEEAEEPNCCKHEAENGDKHHPAQRVVRIDPSRCNQDPNQTSKNL